LSKWADKNSEITKDEKEAQTPAADDVYYYLTVYAILGMIEVVIKLANDLMYFFRCARASKVVHKNLLNNVLRSPMKFFDTNPTGRIVNRFTSDMDTMDQMIPFELLDFIWCLMENITTVLLISVTTPPFIGIIVPLLGIYFFIQRIYITSSRQLKRLYSISKSPIFSHFSETINGASTIRAYKHQTRFIQDSQDKVSVNVTSIYLNLMSNRWLAMRLENLGFLMIFFAALFAVVAKDSLSAGQAGLSITSSFQIIG
jgi:ABC-type multidrug transport system fused ATPase/permease subunit